VHRQNSTWNRQELYERVWQFPLRKLAIEYRNHALYAFKS
jgi:hypothetical protein